MKSKQETTAFTPRNMRRFALMQRCFTLGIANSSSTLTWRTKGGPPSKLWVSGGLNGLIQCIDGYRVHPGIIAGLRDSGQFSEAFLQRLREARARVDVAGVEEGDIIESGSMILELQGSNFDCVLASTLVEHTVGMGTEIFTRAIALRRAHPSDKLVYHPLPPAKAPLAEAAVQIAGWDAASDSGVARDVNLPTMVHQERSSPSVQFADPRDTSASPGFLSWLWEWSALCPDLKDWEHDLKLTSGGNSRRLYRILNDQGERIRDAEEPTGTPLQEDMRKVVQRYADRGHPCRPLPDPMRSGALHRRAAAEFGEAY
jgi:hypothetical protein